MAKTIQLKAEMEDLIMAAQDQSLATRYYNHGIIKVGTDPLIHNDPQCKYVADMKRLVISGCSELAKTEYL